MGDDFDQQVHDLLADIRAVSTSVTSPNSGFAQNAELGMRAYGRGPEHAILLTAQIAAIRLRQVDEARASQGLKSSGFLRDELGAATIRLQPRAGRRSAPVDALDYLEEFVGAFVPEREPIVDLIQAHGLLAIGQGFTSEQILERLEPRVSLDEHACGRVCEVDHRHEADWLRDFP